MRLSLFFFLHLVALVILLIVHPHARADDGWTIDQTSKEYIYLSKNGEFLYGDKLVFSMSYKDCNTIHQLFTVLTTKNINDISHLKNKRIPISLNNNELSAELIYIQPILDDRAYWIVFELGTYETQKYVKLLKGFLEENEAYEISLSNGLNFEVKKYFDITKNKWILDNFSEKFDETYKRCVEKTTHKES